jgi:hypothetical protein
MPLKRLSRVSSTIGPVVDSLAEVGGGTLDQLVATSVVGLLILIPFFAFRALGEVVGERNLVRIFLEQRRETQGGTVSSTMDYLPPSP